MQTQTSQSVQIGDEVDYCPVGSFWVPARVQDILLPDSSSPSSSPSSSNTQTLKQNNSGLQSQSHTTILIRFSCGDSDVTHAVDIHNSSDAKKIAPACEYLRPCAFSRFNNHPTNQHFFL
jgi:hypothetical protein